MKNAKNYCYGCPAFLYEDVCENPYECTEQGFCKRIKEQDKAKSTVALREFYIKEAGFIPSFFKNTK